MFSFDIGIAGRLASAMGASAPPWVPRDYLEAVVPFVLDAENNRGWHDGTAYASESGFLAAPGVAGASAASVRNFGPYDVPGAPNLFPGASDLSATTALAAVGSGSSIAVVGNELELTSGGAGARWRFNLPLQRAAYRWRVKGRKGSNTGGQYPGSAIQASMTGGIYANANFYSGTMGELATIVPAASAAQRYAGVLGANSATGTSYFDDAFLTQVKPFSLYNQAEGSAVIEGVADNSGGDQVLLDITNTLAGQSGDYDYIRITRAAATGEITCAVGIMASVAFSQSLGIVTSGNPIRIALGWKDAALSICINGSAPLAKVSATQIESHAVMRFAGSLSGNAWAGFRRGYYIPSKQPDWWLQHASTGFADTDIFTEGDSYAAGAGTVGLSGSLRSATSRVVISTGLGGSSLEQVLSRLQAQRNARGRILVIWDGSANGYTSVSYSCSLIDQIITWHGRPERVIYVPSVAVGPSSDGVKSAFTQDLESIRDYIASTGVHSVNPVPLINALASGSAQDLKDISAGVVCQSLLQDPVHLIQPAMDAIVDKIEEILPSIS